LSGTRLGLFHWHPADATPPSLPGWVGHCLGLEVGGSRAVAGGARRGAAGTMGGLLKRQGLAVNGGLQESQHGGGCQEGARCLEFHGCRNRQPLVGSAARRSPGQPRRLGRRLGLPSAHHLHNTQCSYRSTPSCDEGNGKGSVCREWFTCSGSLFIRISWHSSSSLMGDAHLCTIYAPPILVRLRGPVGRLRYSLACNRPCAAALCRWRHTPVVHMHAAESRCESG
jgi:hypothetical protein